MLNQEEEKSLRDFCNQNNIPKRMYELLAGLSGRGYRPPTTVDGWKEIHSIVFEHVIDDETAVD